MMLQQEPDTSTIGSTHLLAPRTDAAVAAGVEAAVALQLARLKRGAIEHARAAMEQARRPEEQPESAAANLARATIERVVAELSQGRRPRAIDVVYDELDSLLLAARFDDARVMLIAFAQNALPLAVLLSALTVSLPWRAALGDARVQVSQKAEDMARHQGGETKVRDISRFL